MSQKQSKQEKSVNPISLNKLSKMKSGIFTAEQVPFEVYLQLPFVNASSLIVGYHQSMKHMHASVNSMLDDKSTPDRVLGSALHCYVLEGEESFNERFIIRGSCRGVKKDKRGSVCGGNGKHLDSEGTWFCGVHKKQAVGEITEPDNALTIDQHERLLNTAFQLSKHPSNRDLNYHGFSECTMIWEWNGIVCKCRLDRATMVKGRNLIIDAKKFGTEKFSHAEVSNKVSKLDYWIQSAFYVEGYKQATGIDNVRFEWRFLEDQPPFDIIPATPNLTALEHGRHWCDELLKKYAECLANKKFPGIHDSPHPYIVELKDYVLNKKPEQELCSDEDVVIHSSRL